MCLLYVNLSSGEKSLAFLCSVLYRFFHRAKYASLLCLLSCTVIAVMMVNQMMNLRVGMKELVLAR